MHAPYDIYFLVAGSLPIGVEIMTVTPLLIFLELGHYAGFEQKL